MVRTINAAKSIGVLTTPMARSSRVPSPRSEPVNSPTTAPTTANVMATLRPAKMLGSALYRRIMRYVRYSPSPMERARNSSSISTDAMPCTVLTTIGKTAIRNVMSTFGRSPKPNQTTNNGASASFGIAWDPTRRG